MIPRTTIALHVPGDAPITCVDNAHRRWGVGQGRKRRCDLPLLPPCPCAFPGGDATLLSRCCLRGVLFDATLRLVGAGYARSDRHGSPMPRSSDTNPSAVAGEISREKTAGRVRSPVLFAKRTSYGFIVTNGVYTRPSGQIVRRQFEATICEKSLFCKLLPTIAGSNCRQQLLAAICSQKLSIAVFPTRTRLATRQPITIARA